MANLSRADFKNNEVAVFKKLNALEEGKDKSAGEAAEEADAVRTWEDHMWDNEKLCTVFQTDIDTGVLDDQAIAKHKEFGPNLLTEKKAIPWYIVFLKEQTGFFSLLLWFGSALCFLGFGISKDKTDKSNLYLGVVLAVVVFITGCFSYAQTSKAASLMDDFQNFIPRNALVTRNGEEKRIESKMLVPGDIVHVKGGDNIPADLVLFEVSEMKINNASLTGESEDLLRKVDMRTKNILESGNVAFFGTMCTDGRGKGIVIRIGDDTVIGRIATLSTSTKAKSTPLSNDIHNFIYIISGIAFVLGISFFIFGLFYYDVIINVIFAIGIIVANVPEGLLATVTVALALTAKRMAKKKVLVKNLESVETLGSTSCICSDKTGTLTQNRMTVSQLWYNLEVVEADMNWQSYNQSLKRETQRAEEENRPENPIAAPKYDAKNKDFLDFVKTIALSTTAFFGFNPNQDEIRAAYAKKHKVNPTDVPKEDIPEEMQVEFGEIRQQMIEEEAELPFFKRKCEGDASETGLIKFIQPLLMKEYGGEFEDGMADCRKTFPILKYGTDDKLAQIPFSSEIKFNCLIRNANKDNTTPERAEDNITLYLKGAPDRVIDRCSHVLVNDELQPITESVRKRFDMANEKFANNGERVLGFARIQLDPEHFSKEPVYEFGCEFWKSWKDVKERDPAIAGWFPMWNLTFVGLVSLNDPPRHLVDSSVKKCKAAGIKVIMVTGDQPPTAKAIAHKVNIISDPDLEYNTFCRANPDMDPGEAWKKSKSIVIHGQQLADVYNADEALDDLDIEKGRVLLDWLSKKEVVFARTTPSQKLIIVEACQKLGHVVAVTGDGVNDSPAIKQADIGIAMGCGSDVAQNAADMLLLDDNFSSIVKGVEEGRLIFDNLKKSIAYTLSSNIPEISPFLAFMIFQIPLPLSTVLILCIDLGTDMVPAISFAYENAELDIMERYPRSSRRDRLVNLRLISFSYL